MPDWAIRCGERGGKMGDDRFRARIWEHVASAGADGIPEALIRKADSEMKAAGYKFLTQTFPQYGHRTFLICLYERRLPTMREVGDAVADFTAGVRLNDPEKRAYRDNLVSDWGEAVEREEAS